MNLVSEIAAAWGWTGIRPEEVVGENDFGNLMVKDVSGKFWRICPEDLYCRVVAKDRGELETLSHDQAFLHDWYMVDLVSQAKERLGVLQPGRKYCLKVPGPLGGEYGGSNLGTVSAIEQISASGDMAEQIEGFPDGPRIDIKVNG